MTVPPLEEIADAADLILEAILVRQKSYLAKNQREVYTDRTAHPIRVLKAPAKPATQRIPSAQPIIVTLFGGEIDIGGVKVIIEDDNLVPFESGARFLLFLRKALRSAAAENRFEPVGEIVGLFQIENGLVRGMVRGTGHGKEIEKLSPDQLLERALRGKRQ